MTTDRHANNHSADGIPFNKRLQEAREALNLERKEVASQLRLTEKIILMMEKNRYAADIPVIFIRGYLRMYAKFLNIPEHEIRKAVENIKAKPINISKAPNTKPIMLDNRHSRYFMNAFSYLIIVTLVGLIGTWWYSHNKPNTTTLLASLTPKAIEAPAIADTTPTNPEASTPSSEPTEPNIIQAPNVLKATTEPSTPSTATEKSKSHTPAKSSNITISDDDDSEDND